jgi:hypothetical protein
LLDVPVNVVAFTVVEFANNALLKYTPLELAENAVFTTIPFLTEKSLSAMVPFPQ